MRFLTHDDCAAHVPRDKLPCAHRLVRAHYHCMHVRLRREGWPRIIGRKLQDGCARSYLLASEAHAHHASHCKAEQLARQGFARYKAPERCPQVRALFWLLALAPHENSLQRCAYWRQQTTHFHCIRDACSYTCRARADLGACM